MAAEGATTGASLGSKRFFLNLLRSKLVITQIIPEDDAIYQCLAENQQGSVLSLARLIVVMSEDRPSAPRNVHAETISSSAILLAWEKPLYNADKVIAYSIHYMKAEGRRWCEDEGVSGSRLSLTVSPGVGGTSQRRPSGVAAEAERRSRRSQEGNFIGIKTGLASTLSAGTLQLKGQRSFREAKQEPKEIFNHSLVSIRCI